MNCEDVFDANHNNDNLAEYIGETVLEVFIYVLLTTNYVDECDDCNRFFLPLPALRLGLDIVSTLPPSSSETHAQK